jgi:DNA (cytosine-5)-methyltransferase 1
VSVTFTDFFCGYGGSSQGLTEAGLTLKWAANHWDRAIETHAANFRDADHFQGDISGYDMRRVPSADVAWMSPECTWHSPAGGRKRLRAELDLFDDYVPDAAGERSRATMWDVVRAAEAKQFRVVIVENVVEVTTWPLFDNWLSGMETLGYEHQIVCVTAAHIGGDSNPHAPQWRDRIYFVFYKRGVPMPTIEPRPLAWCPQCGGVVEARQSWKRTDRRRIGKYGPQYVYVCTGAHPTVVVEPYVLPAAAAIDWSDLGTPIGDRERPLAAATIRRIEAGIRMFARPVVMAAAGQTYDAASEGQPRKFYRVTPADGAPLDPRLTTAGDGIAVPPFVTNVRHGADDHGRQFLPGGQPMPTAQTKIGDGVVMPPFIDVARTHNRPRSTDVPLAPVTTGQNQGLVSPPMIIAGYDYAGGDERRVKPADGAPLHTVVANGRGHHQLVVPPFIAEMRGTSSARGAVDDALGAVTAGGNHHGLTVPDGAFLSRQYGSRGEGVHLNTGAVDEPLHPITASGGNHALVIPYRRGRAQRTSESPLPVQTTTRTTALLVPDFSAAELAEIVQRSRFRMLGPREHLRAQRFPDSYLVKGNKGEQTKGAGNAVAANVAHWIGTFVLIALASTEKRRAAA